MHACVRACTACSCAEQILLTTVVFLIPVQRNCLAVSSVVDELDDDCDDLNDNSNNDSLNEWTESGGIGDRA